MVCNRFLGDKKTITFWRLLVTLKSQKKNFVEKQRWRARANIEQKPYRASLMKIISHWEMVAPQSALKEIFI